MTKVLYLPQEPNGTYVLTLGGTIVNVLELSQDPNDPKSPKTLRVIIDETRSTDHRDNLKAAQKSPGDVLFPETQRKMVQGLLQPEQSK